MKVLPCLFPRKFDYLKKNVCKCRHCESNKIAARHLGCIIIFITNK